MAGEPIERAEDRAARLAALARRDAAHRARLFRVYLALLAVPVLAVIWILARGDAPTSARDLYDVVDRRIAQRQREVDAQLQRTRSLSERQLQDNHAYRASLDKDVSALERRIGEESRRRAAELATARQSSTSQLGALNGMLDDVQRRVSDVDTKYDQRVGQIDQKATAAGQMVMQAVQAARELGSKVEGLSANRRKLTSGLVLQEDFEPFDPAKGPPDAVKASLDRLVADIAADPKEVYFEIVGHTEATFDSAGSRRAAQRVNRIQEYLYTQHRVPLHRVRTIVLHGASNAPSPEGVVVGVRSPEAAEEPGPAAGR